MQEIKTSDLTAENIVTFLKDVFERCGDEEYLGENVTMSEHMLQAATLAQERGFSEEIIVSALLHDIGHFTSEFGSFSMDDNEDKFHEEAGAKVLEKFFPSIVIDCIKFHVLAKRYLCAKKPQYLKSLSKASIHSLKLQGGPMLRNEIDIFEKNPNLDNIIKVRYLDDEAKEINKKTYNFDYFAPIVQKVVNSV